jgi:hypothetical protein
VITATLAIGVGILVRFIDHKDFHTVGDGMWWAVVTLGTVGYTTSFRTVLGAA